jgi:N-acetyltransferase 10
MRRLHACLRASEEARVRAALPEPAPAPDMQPLAVGVDEDLEEGAARVNAAMREQQAALLGTLDMERYAIRGQDAEWDAALRGKGVPKTGFLSVKRGAAGEGGAAEAEAEAPEAPRSEHKKHKKHKERDGERGSEKKRRESK